MTVTYTAQVATSSFSCFLKLLVRWRGSIYKLLWKDFIVFAFLFYLLSFLYRFVLNDDQKVIFETIVRYCEVRNALIPVAFVLGFYVSLVMTRYWSQLGHIPWPDHMAMFVTANVQGLDERGRLMRRTMLRYINLAYAITMSSISQSVKKRFPSLDYLVNAGLLTASEKKVLDKIQTPHNKFFIPLAWTTSLVTRARKEGRIKDDFAVKTLIDEINNFRMHLATLFVYDMISMPLVYTQVVTIAVYTFFLACLMGRQFIKGGDVSLPDVYFPVFTFLEYLFYMGWLKVAECFVNPFGEDEDDFDMNFLIDRNLQVSYLIVDEIHDEHPDLIRDQYWDEVVFNMPYTTASEQFRVKNPHLGSAVDLTLSAKEKEIAFPLETVGELEEVESSTEQEVTDSSARHQRPSYGSHGGPLHSGPLHSGPLHSGRHMFRRGVESPPARPFVPTSFIVGSVDTVFPPGSPSTAGVGKNNNMSPPLSPRTPADDGMQFRMDEDFDESKESDPLILSPPSPSNSSVPQEVFEMKAILARSLSAKLSTTPTDNEQQQHPLAKSVPVGELSQQPHRQQLTSVQEAVEQSDNDDVHLTHRKSPGLTIVLPSTSQQQSHVQPTDEPAVETEAGAEAGQRQPVRQRYVAPPTLTPEIPLSPPLTTPLWVRGPQQPFQ